MKEDEMSTTFEKEMEEFNRDNALLDLWIDAIEQADEEGRPRPSFGEFSENASRPKKEE